MDFGHQGVADWPSSFQNKSAVSCGVGLEVSTYFTIGMSHCRLSKTDECNEEVLLPDNDPHHLGAILAQGNVVRVFDLGHTHPPN